jgi:hypothetical protein
MQMNNETDKEIESSGQVEHRKLSNWSIWSVIFGALSFLYFCFLYPDFTIRFDPEYYAFIISYFVILLLPPLIFGCIAIHRIKKNPQRYRGIWFALVGIAFAGPMLFIFINHSMIAPFLALNTLRSRLENVTQINVRLIGLKKVGGGHSDYIMQNEVVFEEKDPAKIAKVIKNIDIAPFGCSHMLCECRANIKFEFYREGEPPFVLGFHLAQSLRGHPEWETVYLTRKSISFLADWLAANNVTGPKEAIEKRKSPSK